MPKLRKYKRPQGRGTTWLRIIRDTDKYPSDRRGRTQFVKIVGLRAGRSRTTHMMTFVARTSSPELYGLKWVIHQYATTAQFIDDDRVKLSCSCPDFCYRWEWGLWRVGSAEIRYSNGAPPYRMNPMAGSRAGSCKHTMALAFLLRDMGKLTRRFTLPPRPPLTPKPANKSLLSRLPRMTPQQPTRFRTGGN